MFKAFKVKSPEVAEEMLKLMDDVDKYKDVLPINKRLRIKRVKKMCKII